MSARQRAIRIAEAQDKNKLLLNDLDLIYANHSDASIRKQAMDMGNVLLLGINFDKKDLKMRQGFNRFLMQVRTFIEINK
jgi:hypothetical protein